MRRIPLFTAFVLAITLAGCASTPTPADDPTITEPTPSPTEIVSIVTEWTSLQLHDACQRFQQEQADAADPANGIAWMSAEATEITGIETNRTVTIKAIVVDSATGDDAGADFTCEITGSPEDFDVADLGSVIHQAE